MSEVEKIVREVDSFMKMEGLPLTQEDKKRIETCLTNPKAAGDIIRELIEKHSAKSAVRS